MIPPQRYFPWRIARSHFLSQFVYFLLLIGFGVFAIHRILAEALARSPVATQLNASDLLAEMDHKTALLAIWAAALTALYAFWSTRAYARPLGALIQRARELRRLDTPIPPEFLEPEESDDQPGEWSDLERALTRIHFDLRMKSETEARERDELSTLLEAVSDAILAVDRTGLPLFFNAQFARFFPVAKVNQQLSRNERPSLGEMFRVPEVLQGFQSVMRTGERKLVSASLHTTAFSTPRHFSLSIAPLQQTGIVDVYGAIAVFHDVTELKQSEQIRIEFVGNASHELRTPLTSIKGYVETLKNDFKLERFDEASEFMSIISRNVDRLIYLVNDLLDLSVIESGAELEKSLVSTREVSESALKQLEDRRAQKHQTIQVDYGVEALLGDPDRVEQVLINLIQNAIKYIPEKSQIEVKWEKAEGAIRLRVKDNGPGIPINHQARLFERFYRVDAGRSREQGGTGLGLAIVKHIMLKHGGHIRLQSAAGQGSEFICSFPEETN